MDGWRLGRRPALDGIRGFAILLVLSCHVLDPLKPGAFHALGAAGVTLFFTLSGFLITSLLLEDRSAPGARLGRFYLRRALRLFPALVAAVLGISAVTSLTYGFVPNPGPTLLYGANWVEAYGHVLPFYGPTWSLSIEEQFYLAAPLVLILLARRPVGLLAVILGGITLSTVLRFVLYDGGDGSLRVYYGTDTQASTLLVGCLLAVLAHLGLRESRRGWVVPVGAFALAMLAVVNVYVVGDVWVPTVVPFVGAAMIWTACSQGGFLMNHVLRYIGRRSYAIYLWHIAMLWASSELFDHRIPLVSGLVGVALTFVVAEVSWHVVEQPFQRLGRRSRNAAGPLTVTPAG